MAIDTLSLIREKIRALCSDFSSSETETFTYSSSAIFTLSEDNINSVTSVEQNGVELGSGDYSFDSDTNKITISASLTSGDIIEVIYAYNKYSNSELNEYMKASLVWLSVYDDSAKDFEIETNDIYPTPSGQEEDIIALISSILINPEYSEYVLPNVRIKYPRTMDKEQRIEKLILKWTFSKGINGVLEWN